MKINQRSGNISYLRISDFNMEDYSLWEEARMYPVLERRRRVRHDFFDELSNQEFFETTRFTKEGAIMLTNRLHGRLHRDNDRGCPLAPLAQVLTIVHSLS